jgi:hypothetical protein
VTTYLFTFQMDDGRIVHVEGKDDPDIAHILEDHLGQRCMLRGPYDPDAVEANSVMTGFLIKP